MEADFMSVIWTKALMPLLEIVLFTGIILFFATGKHITPWPQFAHVVVTHVPIFKGSVLKSYFFS